METEPAVQQPASSNRRMGKMNARSATRIAVGLGVVLVVPALWITGGFTIMRSAYSRLRGETIVVDSSAKSFGIAAPGDRVTVSFNLINQGRESVRIVGCKAGCTCMVPDDLPFAIDPKGRRDFVVSIQVPPRKRGGPPVTRKLAMTLFTSNPAQPEILLTVSGEVRGKPSAEKLVP